jgi:predicted RNase H-like nuclease (RuvC/YqgF family)
MPTRKNAELREKELRLALLRIRHGKARTGAVRVSVLSVAREAGVSAALIHNHYPAIAEDIRREQGKDSRSQRDAKHEALKRERERTRQLRQEISALQLDVQRLSSINEVLHAEIRALRAKGSAVIPFVASRTSLP